jgi:L-alanine-DL-glutamate epimerase-like enolase superfamily enzyme
MKITAIETIYLARGVTVHAGPIQWLWVRIHTDDGLTGLGETYPWPEAEASVVRRALAPVLLGRDPLRRDMLWADMFRAISYSGWAGAEMRAISAVDMALWDVAGKAAGVPVYQLLGGASRDRIRTYNTCYDHISFMTEPVRLARSLLDAGIGAMKIWPFDAMALKNGGQFITRHELREALEPLRLIKAEFGDEMEVAMEFHGYWNVQCAIQIARACEVYEPMWLEEMLPQDNLAVYAELAAATCLPLCVSERLMTRWSFRELLANGAARIIMPDISWCGGLSEAKKIATSAETMFRPVAPHNCGGPVLHAASLHLAANLPNLFILESVRRHYDDEYRGLVTRTFPCTDGGFDLPSGPGLGIELSTDTMARPDATVARMDA